MKKSLLILLTAGALNMQSQVNLTSSLVACYPLNGTAIDNYSNNLSGTMYNTSPASDQYNVAGQAIEFMGNATSYIELPNSPLLKSISGVSFSGWVYFKSFQLDDHLVFTKNNSSSSFAAYSLISYNTGNYYFRTYKENGTPNFAQSSTQIQLNTWYHVVFTIDNSLLKIYVNGVMENSVPSTADFDYDASNKTVILGGTNELNYNTPFNGFMNNVRFYNRVINAQEVLALYQQDPSCVMETVGITKHHLNSAIRLYPVVTTGELTVELNDREYAEASVYSVSGQLIKHVNLRHGKNQVSVDELSAGVYLFSVEGEAAEKIIVVK